jgi:hypothetical protein
MLGVLAEDAVGEPYDIDLKELRRPPVRRAKEQPPREPIESVSSTPNAGQENSSYIVRYGDHLFLILMQRYGLSNEAAEKLIPEIMRLNGIKNPKGLLVGQRLTIPLQQVKDNASNAPSKKSRKTIKPSPQPESAGATKTPDIREIAASASRPCSLASEVAKQLGVSVSALSPLIYAESVSVSNDALKMVVVCGLEPAEAYTLERLLARHSQKLLVFKADEVPRKVIEELADRLGISFHLSNPDTATELPLTYFFPTAIDGKGLMLTIRPDLPVPK